MNLPEVKKLAVSSIVLPGNFAATRAADRIGDLAASMEEHGVFSLPVVTWDGSRWKLIAGHDRVAALMRIKAKQALCIVVSGDERSLRRLSVAENLYRRHDDKAELLRLIDERAAEPGEELGDTVAEVPAHRPATARGKARAAVAKATGRNPRSLARADQREAKKVAQKEDRGGTEAGEAPQPAPVADHQAETMARLVAAKFDFLGTTPGLAWLLRVEDVIAIIDEADKLCRLAQSQVTELLHMTFPGALQQRLKEDTHHAAASLRQARPCMVCPWCKDTSLGGGRAPCLPCSSTGYIVEEQRGGVPKELLQPGVVAVNGRFVKAGAPLQQFANKHRMAVKLVGEDGSETDFEPAEDTAVES
ncbi:MAG TPA: ParB/RepB/Spo0J family partition protein [Mycobacterium sp.]|nr:ParB/RepB/Spo0J family partition protein [Mycobacterium sp.]